MERSFGRRYLRSSVCALMVALASSSACADDDPAQDEARPTVDSLEALFERLCLRRMECGNSWGPEDTIENCVDVSVTGYRDKPTHCLNLVVDYYECEVDVSSCAEFNQVPAMECRDLLHTAESECPPGTGF